MVRRSCRLLLLAAAGSICCTAAYAQEAAQRDEGSVLDLQEEVDVVHEQRSAGRPLKDLIKVRFNLESTFVPDTDFDGFDAALYRPAGRLKVTVPVSKHAAIRFVTNFSSDVYDFNDVEEDPFRIGAGSGDPFDALHSFGLRLQTGYQIDDLTFFSDREKWSVLAEGAFRSSWEDGSSFSHGVRGGGAFALGYRLGKSLELALGVGVGSRPARSGVAVRPLFELDWWITDSWRLSSSGQGARILYAMSDRLAFFGRGTLQNRRYRLDKRPGAIGRGSITDRQIPAELGVRWQIGRHVRLTGAVGVVAYHKLRLRDSDGDKVGSSVTGDPAPYFRIRLDLQP